MNIKLIKCLPNYLRIICSLIDIQNLQKTVRFLIIFDYIKMNINLRKTAVAAIVSFSFLTGCGGGSSSSNSSEETISPTELKESSQEVVDETTGITYQLIEVDENSKMTLKTDDSGFTLASGSGDISSEKLVVKGHLIIK